MSFVRCKEREAKKGKVNLLVTDAYIESFQPPVKHFGPPPLGQVTDYQRRTAGWLVDLHLSWRRSNPAHFRADTF